MDRKLGGLIAAALLSGCATMSQPSMTPQQSAALMDAGIRLLQNSGYSTQPRAWYQAPVTQQAQPAAAPPPVTTQTTCRELSNGATHCITYYSDGTPATHMTCRTLSNGQVSCM
jgi:hypothetical protein